MTGVWRLVAAGLVMTFVVAWMIADRMLILSRGREIVVAVEPVDPTDLFRGEYVRLGYAFSRIDSTHIAGLDKAAGREGETTIYVVLKPEAGRYVLDYATTTAPTISGDQVMLTGKAYAGSGSPQIVVRYGVERYFVPQGHGTPIETGVNERRTEVVLAVTTEGRAAIKALLLDGKRVYEEGIF